jgi:Domain of unknown function (DUF4157)
MRDFELEPTRHRVRAPEADATAGHDPAPGGSLAVTRSPALDAAAVMRLQRTAGNTGVVQLLGSEDEQRSPVSDVIGSGGGSPLDAGTRSTMEAAFGTSFEHVRVHTDERASKSAESVGANAYTVGSDVVFRSGQFNPSTPAGQRTIAHELTHVVQQSQGPVDGTDAPGGIRVSSPSDRFERAADQTADHVLSSVQSFPSPATASAGSASTATAQLEEDETAANPAVQRQAEEEEEEMET